MSIVGTRSLDRGLQATRTRSSFGWVGLFVAQTMLVMTRHVRWHRRLGVAGAVLGASIPIVGMATAVAMARFNVLHGFRSPDEAAAFQVIPLFDMIAFGITCFLAVRWRRAPGYHKRLMFLATCGLTAAAFARFPFITVDAFRWYGGVDLLIVLAIWRDVAVERTVHPVYAYGVPLLLLGQVVTMTLFLQRVPAWMVIGHWIVR